jgi:hypothetical protein
MLAKHPQIEELRKLGQRHSEKVSGGVWLVLAKSESALGIRDVSCDYLPLIGGSA